MIFKKKPGNKLRARRTPYKRLDGTIRNYDSKLEAKKARELDILLSKGEIKNWSPQFQITIPFRNKSGCMVHCLKHKVDFRVTKNDGNYLLIESKGSYKERREYTIIKNLIKHIWLPENLDYKYEIHYEKKILTL